MPLGNWHGARLKPAIQHLFHPFVGSATLSEGYFINKRTVQVDLPTPVNGLGGDSVTGRFLEFSNRADDNKVVFIIDVLPDRQWRAPVTVAADSPVPGTFQPLAKAALFNMRRYPVDIFGGFYHVLPDFGNFYKPGAGSKVHQGRITAPAERISVLGNLGGENPPIAGQLGDNVLISLFKELAGYLC